MKKTLFFVLFCSFSLALAARDGDTLRLRADNIDAVLRAMTIREKASLVVGNGWGSMWSAFRLSLQTGHPVPGAAGETRAIRRLGIPSVILSDGPSGVRICSSREGDQRDYNATAFPSPLLLASSRDTALVRRVGRAMGAEARAMGVDVLLGPAMNLQRSVLCGRVYEYFSEDPQLSGQMAAAMVMGLQESGVGACVKHFAGNNQESHRMRVDALIDSAVLRDLYLENFRIAIAGARPWAVMSAYNRVNGVSCQENHWLLTEILRDEWHFDGVVMTDWWFRKHSVKQHNAGNDLLMPGSGMSVLDICYGVKHGKIAKERLDEAARRVLEMVVKTATFLGTHDGQTLDSVRQQNAQIAREAAARSMILLKNDHHTLPLTEQGKVALYGCSGYELIAGGMGSGFVHTAYTVSLAEGLSAQGFELLEAPKTWYAQYMRKNGHRLHQGGFGPVNQYTGMSAFREPALDSLAVWEQAQEADLAILSIGRQAGEGKDRSLSEDWLMTEKEAANLRLVCRAFHAAGKRVVVVLNIIGPIETASWKELPDAILLTWTPGQEGGHAMADVLSGKVNPQGKLPITMPVNYFDAPVAKHFPLSGKDLELVPDTMHLSATESEAHYLEGRLFGYRYYDNARLLPSYPYGFGLSY